MTSLPSPPVTPRAGPRIPSGPRPLREGTGSSGATSYSSIPQALSRHDRSIQPLGSIGILERVNSSEALIDQEHDFTVSPEGSPTYGQSRSSIRSQSPSPSVKISLQQERAKSLANPALTDALTSGVRPQTAPGPALIVPSPFAAPRPASPNSTRNTAKPKPKPSRLNTTDLVIPGGSLPPKPISPGLEHWQQVRSHVLAPSPGEENISQNSGRARGKKLGIVSKAAGRFGFRNAAEHVMGYDERRVSMLGLTEGLGDFSVAEKEEITRERRKFARDVKTCLDACAQEESRRRLLRIGTGINPSTNEKKHAATSVHSSQHAVRNVTFDPDFSAFAPLLTELHRHLPAARAKKLWSRTCPHHSAILGELAVAFLPDSASTPGERQQVLEVFGAVARNWAPDSADEDLDRWLWLCRGLIIDDRQLRTRGLTLLVGFLHGDPSFPQGPDRPRSVHAFLNLADALLTLEHAMETTTRSGNDHHKKVNGLLQGLSAGEILDLDEASLADLLGSTELRVSLGGLERELVWMAVGRLMGSNIEVANWLLSNQAKRLQRLSPAPILHATPPIILRLRTLASSYFLASFSAITSATIETAVVSQIWDAARMFIFSQIDYLPKDNESLAICMGGFLMVMEMQNHCKDRDLEDSGPDPFKISSFRAHEHREMVVKFLSEPRWSTGIDTATKQIVRTHPLPRVCRLLQHFLRTRALFQLGSECLTEFWTRLGSLSHVPIETRPFLLWLSSHQPQLFFRPLFSLSAATQAITLAANLSVVSLQSRVIGRSRFWTSADQQMVVIVLMGDVAVKQSKGKAKEGDGVIVKVKVGRYAVLLELVRAFEEIEEEAGSGNHLRGFIDAVESRVCGMLETEEVDGRLPSAYCSLLCRLFLQMRLVTQSLRRPPWIRLVTSWYSDLVDPPAGVPGSDVLLMLSSVYAITEAKVQDNTPKTPKQSRDPHRQESGTPQLFRVTDVIPEQSSAYPVSSLLVVVNSCLSSEDWAILCPIVWRLAGELKKDKKAMTFLLMKCAEKVPIQLRSIIISDMSSPDLDKRSSALRKLAETYGWRYEMFDQQILRDRRAPIFNFPQKTLGFVTTEIGSPFWVPPPAIQDAALQRFGTSLPLELRQRLMELGWSEDDPIAGRSDWQQIPVTSLPSGQYQLDETGIDSDKSTGPVRPLIRRSSRGSGRSFSSQRRKAIFAPLLLAMVQDQTSLSLRESEGSISASSSELVRLLQRDDPTAFLRALTDQMTDGVAPRLATLNSIVISATPGFAYSALNALVGILKTALRSDDTLASYGSALATISLLVPRVSEMSLRDIRKHKAEAALLPASIHEDAAGFKLHAPWREHVIPVQIAQLLILTEILRANPREVYLVKKMLSNLQIQTSIHSRPFSRAWIILITRLFSTVNRNYNDRAELRHFLQNISAILKEHGTRDILIAAHAMRIFILCSARFRRLFASMGFSTIMRAVYDTYAYANPGIRDCIEYASRSFYRIHDDAFVYQACVVIAEGDFDAESAWSLLASLSNGYSAGSGIPSGIRGLNDKEELDALVQMISGPDIAVAEIGTAAAMKRAQKLASVSIEDAVFPRENIVRLFVTVIASNPGTTQAKAFLRLFAALTPYLMNGSTQQLVREGMEALGEVIMNGKQGDGVANPSSHLGMSDSREDFLGTKREYVFLVDAFARSGGTPGPASIRRTLEIILEVLRIQPAAVGTAASSILSHLGKTHLRGLRSSEFLRDIAPFFRDFATAVDFSGVLDQITGLIRHSSYALDPQTTKVIIQLYLEPAMLLLARNPKDNTAFSAAFRVSIVGMLSAALFLDEDALGALEAHPPSADLLVSVVLPLSLLLDEPVGINKEGIYTSIWIRLLHYVIQSPHGGHEARVPSIMPRTVAAQVVFSLQAIKVITVRALSSLSRVKGLWTYIAQRLLALVEEGNARFLEGHTPQAPRVVDWMTWSLFELLSLHRSPLQIDMRHRMRTAVATLHRDGAQSAPSTPGIGTRKASSPHLSGRARNPSARSPISVMPARMTSNPSLEHNLHARTPSYSHTSRLTPEHAGHSMMTSQHLTPLLSRQARMQSGSSLRPTFSDLSARRTSRPAFEPFPGGGEIAFRFPSSAPVRSGGGGAIVHLLGTPSQVLPVTSSSFPVLAPGSHCGGHQATEAIRLTSDTLITGTRRAMRVCQMVFGYELEHDEEEDLVRIWSVHDALYVISEQTKTLVEEEFSDVFNPGRRDREPGSPERVRRK